MWLQKHDAPAAQPAVALIAPVACMQATGLALPGADLDVVVLGANVVLQNPASGYSHEARHAVSGLLEVAAIRV